MWEHLAHYRIILGSQSPRRVELLRGLDLDFEQHSLPDIDESYPEGLPLQEIPRYIATRKAEAYYTSLREDTLLITADTLVFAEGEVLGKPKTQEEAAAMLHRLSGRRHYVTTGVSIRTSQHDLSFADTAAHRRRSITTSSATRLWTRRVPMGYRSGSATWLSLASRARSTL